MKNYELIEHTADVGIRAFGSSLGEMFANAAKGMFNIILGDSDVEAKGEIEVRLESENLEELLVDWLSELLYIHEAEAWVFCDFDVVVEGSRLKARVLGETFDSKKHRIETQIKAVTYHMLEVDEKKGYVQVLFDI